MTVNSQEPRDSPASQPADETNILLASPAAIDGTDGSVNIDTILSQIGLSRLQIACVLICGFGNAADAVELLSISYILPVLDFASEEEKGTLSAAVFLGMLVGSLLFGISSDTMGRRGSLLVSTLVNLVFGLLFAAAGFIIPEGSGLLWAMIVFRFLAGVGVGGCMPIVFPYAAELVPAHSRGTMLIGGVAAFWMLGGIYAAGMAWILLGILKLHWSIYSFCAALPSLACVICAFIVLPESPRYLLLKGKKSELAAVLRRFARSARVHIDIREEELTVYGGSKPKKVSSLVQEVIELSKPLVTGDLKRSFWVQAIVWFSLCFGWYGLIIWFPSLFKRRNIPDEDVYAMAFYTAASNLPGNIVSAFLADKIGRRWLLSGSMILAAGASFGFIFVNTTWEATLTSCLFNGLSVGAWNALDVVTSEGFPTKSRSAATGILAAIGRIGALLAQPVFGAFSSIVVVMIISCSFMLVGGIATMFLPETSGKVLTDVESNIKE